MPRKKPVYPLHDSAIQLIAESLNLDPLRVEKTVTSFFGGKGLKAKHKSEQRVHIWGYFKIERTKKGFIHYMNKVHKKRNKIKRATKKYQLKKRDLNREIRHFTKYYVFYQSEYWKDV